MTGRSAPAAVLWIVAADDSFDDLDCAERLACRHLSDQPEVRMAARVAAKRAARDVLGNGIDPSELMITRQENGAPVINTRTHLHDAIGQPKITMSHDRGWGAGLAWLADAPATDDRTDDHTDDHRSGNSS